MKSIFAQFDDYQDAEQAVDALVEEGFDEASMNVIVREQLAKRRLDVNLHKVDVMKSDEVGSDTARGLTRLRPERAVTTIAATARTASSPTSPATSTAVRPLRTTGSAAPPAVSAGSEPVATRPSSVTPASAVMVSRSNTRSTANEAKPVG